MKKLLPVFFIILSFALFLTGCETTVNIHGASICETTMAGSKNFSVFVSYFQDSRLENLGVDIQLRFNKKCEVVFNKDGEDKLTFQIEDFDTWYSLENLIAKAKGEENYENFSLHKDAINKTYIFSSEEDLEISLRVVAGNIVENSFKTGYILTETMPISDVFVLKIKN